jgi:hypothetical protein
MNLWTLNVKVNGSFVSFQYILEKYRDKFHSSRTAKSLEAHYYRMKRTGALGPEGAASVDIKPAPGSVQSPPIIQQQTIELVPNIHGQKYIQPNIAVSGLYSSQLLIYFHRGREYSFHCY